MEDVKFALADAAPFWVTGIIIYQTLKILNCHYHLAKFEVCLCHTVQAYYYSLA